MIGIGHNSVNEFVDIDFSNPGNWIALSRDVMSHPVVGAGQPVKPDNPKKSAYSRMEAWIDLLCLAQYKPGRINNKGEVMSLAVGQLMGARAFLADRWNWTEKTVRGYLDTLETHGMITKPAHSGIEKGQPRASVRSNQCNVLTISNYGKYQFINDAIESYISTLKGPAKGQRRASEGPESNKETQKQDSNPPTPLSQGGARPPSAKKSKFREAQIQLTTEAFDLYNETAKRLGFGVVMSYTDARRTRMLKRLEDIGGLEPFKVALSAIEHVPFLMGRVKPKPGESPFQLDIERLMQTDGNLGDVLAKLIDKAAQVAGGAGDPPPRNGKVWGWWRKNIVVIKQMSIERWREIDAHAKPNGTWPWDIMGPPPGHPECLVPEELLAEKGYVDIYRGQIRHN